MSIKLRKLLNLTEQAPQPPMGDPLAMGAPVAAPITPPGGMDAGLPDEPPTPEPGADATQEPEDPSEYDFTRDFRAFEDKKNKAESEAKKVLMDKMNERLLNKTIVANASRGYGQPKTDYTIENVKKVSVEFWYKDYVVIATDENDKKYFLTPGINIKIESEGSEPAPGAEEDPAGQQPPTDVAAPGGQPPAPGAEEAPNQTGAEPASADAPGVPPATDQSPVDAAPPAAAPAPAPAAPQPAVPGQPQDPNLPPKKKKKVPPVAEWIQRDLNQFLTEFMSDDVKDDGGRVNYIPYLKQATKVLAESVNGDKVKCKLIIPENHMVRNLQNRDIKLAAIDSMRQQTKYGQFSKGSVDITKQGRYYLLEYVKEVGWNN